LTYGFDSSLSAAVEDKAVTEERDNAAVITNIAVFRNINTPPE
jgi:hypothetical protein